MEISPKQGDPERSTHVYPWPFYGSKTPDPLEKNSATRYLIGDKLLKFHVVFPQNGTAVPQYIKRVINSFPHSETKSALRTCMQLISYRSVP